ncbi:MAG: DUF1059 domain-containing protein [Pseudomonadota bacterium]
MARKFVDCREYPESKCSVAVSADTEDEVVDAAVDHAVKHHGHQDTPEFRDQIRHMVKEGPPPA